MDGLQSMTEKINVPKVAFKECVVQYPRLGFCSLATSFYPPTDGQVKFFRVELEKNSNLEALLGTDFFLIFNQLIVLALTKFYPG